MVARMWHVIPRFVRRRSILLEVDVRLIHIFNLRYEKVLEHAVLSIFINSYCFFLIFKKYGAIIRPCMKLHHTVTRSVLQSSCVHTSFVWSGYTFWLNLILCNLSPMRGKLLRVIIKKTGVHQIFFFCILIITLKDDLITNFTTNP